MAPHLSPDMAREFGARLRALREGEDMSLRALAEVVDYSYAHLAKVEVGTRPPTVDLARQCDRALRTGGQLARLLQRPPAQLPPLPEPFVGRRDPLRRVNDILSRAFHPGAPLLALIDGPPGVGKSALALRWAHTARANDWYPDGQLYVDLRGYSSRPPASPVAVLEEILRALGVTSSRPAGLDELANRYRTEMAEKRMLLVIDNARDAEQVAPLLPGSSTCAVLVTSRTAMPGLAVRYGARRVALDPLNSRESSALLTAIVAGRVPADQALIGDLARLCHGIPLALRIAAEVALTPGTTVRHLVRSLQNDHQLDHLRVGDEPSTSMTAVISWSYTSLPQPAARLWRLLGLYHGSDLSLEAIAALAGTSPATTRDLVATLLERNLLEHRSSPGGDGHYHLHDLLRLYAAQRAEAEETTESRTQAVKRLTHWYLAAGSAATNFLSPRHHAPYPRRPDYLEPDPPAPFLDRTAALRWLDSEQQAFTPLVRIAITYGDTAVAWQLALAVGEWLRIRQPVAVWVDIYEAAWAATWLDGDASAEAAIASRLGEAFRHAGTLDWAMARYERALEIHRTSGHPEELARTLAGMAGVLVEITRLATGTAPPAAKAADPTTARSEHARMSASGRQARSAALEALDLCAPDDPDTRADALIALAQLDQLDTDNPHPYRAARTRLHTALTALHAVASPLPRARVWMALADTYLAEGKPRRALDCLDRARAAYSAMGAGEAQCLRRSAAIHTSLGEDRRAADLLDAAWAIDHAESDSQAAEIAGTIRALGDGRADQQWHLSPLKRTISVARHADYTEATAPQAQMSRSPRKA